MNRSLDERKFFEATGLDLQRLVDRHIGRDSEEQIFEWIGMVLGREYFTIAGSVYIYTIRGWHQHLKDSGMYDHFKQVIAEQRASKAVATDTTSDGSPQPPSGS